MRRRLVKRELAGGERAPLDRRHLGFGMGDLGFGLGLVRKRQEEHPKEPNHTRDETGEINYSILYDDLILNGNLFVYLLEFHWFFFYFYSSAHSS